MQIISYISDWKSNDYYPAIFRGIITSFLCSIENTNFKLIELGSNLKSHDVVAMCFVVKHSFESFPKGTIHLLCVSSEPSLVAPMVVCKYKEHFFVGVDDGRFSLIFNQSDIISYHLPLPDKFSTFMLPHYCVSAIKLILERKWELVNSHPLRVLTKQMPVVLKDAIIGKVIFSDSYGNVISNISKDLFTKFLTYKRTEDSFNGNYNIYVQGPYLKINAISENYSDVVSGEIFALFNSLGLLELGINSGNFAAIEGVELNCEISIMFK